MKLCIDPCQFVKMRGADGYCCRYCGVIAKNRQVKDFVRKPGKQDVYLIKPPSEPKAERSVATES